MRNKVITIQPDNQSTRRPPLWLSSLAPQQGLVICGLLILFCLIGAVWLLLSQPSLGLVWAPSPDHHGLIIQEILHDQQDPAFSTGERILFLAKVNGEPAPLDNELIIQDPDLLAIYADYNRFFERQGIIMEILQQPRITLITAGGAQVTVTPAPYRALDRIAGFLDQQSERRYLPAYWGRRLVLPAGAGGSQVTGADRAGLFRRHPVLIHLLIP